MAVVVAGRVETETENSTLYSNMLISGYSSFERQNYILANMTAPNLVILERNAT